MTFLQATDICLLLLDRLGFPVNADSRIACNALQSGVRLLPDAPQLPVASIPGTVASLLPQPVCGRV